jgi:hypothetical protein
MSPLWTRITRVVIIFVKYLPIRINNYTCSALVDSGNVWRNAISKDFALNQMKLTEADIRPLSTKTIGTAQDRASMRVLGEFIRPLPLQLGGISTCLKTRPVVVEGLSMPFNLAGPFFKKHNIDQIQSEDCIRFQGHDVQLLKRRKGSYTNVEAALSNVYVVKKTVVKPMQHATLTLRAAEVEQKTMRAGDCVVTGSIKFMDTTCSYIIHRTCLTAVLGPAGPVQLAPLLLLSAVPLLQAASD